MIADDTKALCLEDVEFITSEIKRLSDLSVHGKSFKEIYGEGHSGVIEFSAVVRDESTGLELRCGRKARNRFRAIASRLIHPLDDARAWNPDALDDYLHSTFLGFMLDESYSHEADRVSAWVEDAIRQVRFQNREAVHYIPCVALGLGDRQTYRFGPITFVKKALFLKENSQAIEFYETARDRLSERARRNASPSQQHCWQASDDSKKIGVLDAFNRFADGMGWIAAVPVGRCDHSLSEERAEIALRICLASMKLLVEGKEGADLRASDDPSQPKAKHRLSNIGRRKFRTTGNIQFGLPTVPADWDTQILLDAGPIVAVCSLLIQQALDGVRRPFAFEIALRSLTWYADAISDLNDETQLIKCVTAIESLVLPTDRAARAAVIIRGSLLAQRPDWEAKRCAALADELYAVRSNLAHGNVELLSSRRPGLNREALDFAKGVICRFFSICSELRPLGANVEGTKAELLHYYFRLYGRFSVQIEEIVTHYDLGKPWKKLQSQR
ncbi:MAG TPA: hypothetical protein VIJ79_07705 [Acidobacteriaceae bacterium]